jgi:hypothetical protein
LALTPQNSETFFREVDEELRREQLGTFWRSYGLLVAVAIVVALAALGGWLYWQHQQTRQAGIASEQLSQAMMEVGRGKAAEAKTALDTLKQGDNPAYRAAARLTEAAVALEKGDVKAAVASYQAVIDDKDAAQPLRDLALVRQTAAQFDSLQPARIVERLKPLAVAGNPWFGSAGEMTALDYARMNKPELAKPIFAAIAKDEGVPESIRDRAARFAPRVATLASAPTAQPAPSSAKE